MLSNQGRAPESGLRPGELCPVARGKSGASVEIWSVREDPVDNGFQVRIRLCLRNQLGLLGVR